MSVETTPIVQIVDDDPDMRDSLAFVLESAGLETRAYGDADEFRYACLRNRPGCLLFDVCLPRSSGLDLYDELAAQGWRTPVIFMTAYADVPTAVRALKGGAMEFLEKPFDRGMLLERVRSAIACDAARRAAADQRSATASRLARLTAREREVLEMVLAGMPNKGIAGRLEVTERAVELGRARLLKKLNVRSTVELIRLVTHFEASAEKP